MLVHRRHRIVFLILAGIALAPPIATADTPTLKPEATLPIVGKLADGKDLSGAAIIQGRLALCSDEPPQFELLKLEDGEYSVDETVRLVDDDVELDLEGIASDGNVLYLVGSHSLTRMKASPKESYEQNRQQMLRVEEDANRSHVFRVEFDEQRRVVSRQQLNLEKRLERDPMLGPFSMLASKENGIDIEGIATRDDLLYLGFRGPVLREGFVPVMKLSFQNPRSYQLLYVKLAGCGIRDMAATQDGFLIIAGPVGDAPGPFSLYFWNGKDCVPGAGAPEGECRLLGEFSLEDGAKPEGMAVAAESPDEFKLLVVCDDVRGRVFSYRVPKPQPSDD